MMSWCCNNLSKYTWVRLALVLLFILVNVALYTQSKHVILEAILPQLGINRNAALIADTNEGTNSNNSISLLPKLMINDSTPGVRLLELTTQVYEVGKVKPKKPFFGEKVVNAHDFPIIIKPNFTCSNGEVELVICVAISHDNYQGRTVIRDTWGSYAYNISNKALLLFFIGSKSPAIDKSQTDKQINISMESSQYGDILQEDFIDCYNNLSLKSVSILKWVSSFCYNAKFVLKVDDDMYVNIPFLVNILREYASDKSIPNAFIVGSMQVNAQPIRDPSSKWYTPIKLFSESTYPQYVSGTAYSMTAEAAYLLYEASLRVSSFWLEDIYITGLCARKAAVAIYNSGYFSYGKPAVSGCSFIHHISGHRYTHQEIIDIHKQLYDPNRKCKK